MMSEIVLEHEEELEAVTAAREKRAKTPTERRAEKAASAVADLEEHRRLRSETR